MPEGLLLLIGVGFLAGFLIGCIGIGGVILVPALVYLGGVPVQIAIAAAMMGYVLTGVIGTTVYAASGSIDWPMAGRLCAGAMPGALAGAWASNTVPGPVLELGIAALALASGVQAWRGAGVVPPEPKVPSGRSLVAIGLVTGLLSALTGTGGPLVLVPIMMWLDVPVLTAIGLSQAVQLPVAALATAGNVLFGRPDFLMGGVLAAGLAAGSLGGARLAHRLPTALLRRLVIVVLIAVGGAILLRLLAEAVGAAG